MSGRPATNRRVKIEQQGSDLTITIRVASEVGEEIHKFHFTIGSDDNTNEMMGSPLKSKVQWKDGALAVESIATTGQGRNAHQRNVDLILGRANPHLPSEPRHGRPSAREDTIVYEKQPEADWEPPQPPKMAEEVYKNIQIFKGMPAADLMSAMRSFTHSWA